MSETLVLKQVSELPRLTTKELHERWRILYGREPPAGKRDYLVRRLAYRIQELAFGGLKEETRKKLAAAIKDDKPGGRTARAKRRQKRFEGMPATGTRLIREWHGQRHEVTVTREGFEYQGRVFRSLTAVAKAITGAHMSGRAFFGIEKRRGTGKGDGE
jgi:hypothetical protein